MIACVILHNMIIKDEMDLNLEFHYDNVGSRVMPARGADEITTFLDTCRKIENSGSHYQLQENLIEHQW